MAGSQINLILLILFSLKKKKKKAKQIGEQKEEEQGEKKKKNLDRSLLEFLIAGGPDCDMQMINSPLDEKLTRL